MTYLQCRGIAFHPRAARNGIYHTSHSVIFDKFSASVFPLQRAAIAPFVIASYAAQLAPNQLLQIRYGLNHGLHPRALPAPIDAPVDPVSKGHSMKCIRLVSILLLATLLLSGPVMAQAPTAPQANATSSQPTPPAI